MSDRENRELFAASLKTTFRYVLLWNGKCYAFFVQGKEQQLLLSLLHLSVTFAFCFLYIFSKGAKQLC